MTTVAATQNTRNSHLDPPVQHSAESMLFSNVFQRRVERLIASPCELLSGGKIHLEQFQKLYQEIRCSENETVGFIKAPIDSGKPADQEVTGLVVLQGSDIVLLRNPANKEGSSLVSVMNSSSLKFEDVVASPTNYWQTAVEPIVEQQYCYA